MPASEKENITKKRRKSVEKISERMMLSNEIINPEYSEWI